MSDQCRMCPNCHTILLDDGACGHFGAANNGCGHHGEIVATRDPNGPVATAAVNNRCTRCGQIPPAIDSGLFELWDGALRWPDEQREAVIAQILSPRLQRQTWSGATVTPLQPAPQRAPPPQPPAPPPAPPPQSPALQLLPRLIRLLREANATTRQYSVVFVPFIHAVLLSGEMAEHSAAWASHDRVWGPLADEYREFFARSPSLARLLQRTGRGPRYDREQDAKYVSVRGGGSARLRPSAVRQPRPALAVGKRDKPHHSGDFPRAVTAPV
jgi:hypothetical protein